MILLARAGRPSGRVAPTARATGGAAPRPAGRATPGPDCRVEEIPPVVDLPSRVLGSAGGGDSTDKETICAPRTIVRPSVRFSSCTMACAAPGAAPGAAGLFCFLMRRNSSVSARTTFMCCGGIVSKALGHGVSWLENSYLVEGQHLPGHLAAIVQSDSHPVVDLEGRHQCLHRKSGEAGRMIASMIGGFHKWVLHIRNRPAISLRVSLLMSTSRYQCDVLEDSTHHLALLVGRHLCDKMLQSSFFWFSKIGILGPKSGV